MVYSPTPIPTPTTTTTTFLFFLLLFTLSSTQTATTTAITDTAALTEFLHQADTHSNLLLNWTTTTNTCSWHGIKCTKGRVTSLSIPSLSLHGPIHSLAPLSELRLLNLHNNRLNGSLLPITNCSNLKLLYLSNNDFSQQIPPNIGSLHRLLRLDLSNNNFQSLVPNEISNLTRLLTLRLQNNLLSGQVPDLSSALPKLGELNLTNNQLTGHLPEAMQRKYGVESFVGNAGLCGFNPLPICPRTNSSMVPSDPSSFPVTPNAEMRDGESSKGLSTGAIIAIVVGNIVAVVLLMLVIGAYLCWRNNKRDSTYSCSQEEKVYGDRGDSERDQSKLVFYDRRKVFKLEDLLQASAEMLGKGSLGTVYKAILDEECSVAVKRLKDVNPCTRKEFERCMDVMGKLMHPNIVCFRAYYHGKGETLLVHDYLPNGSLQSLLHGNRRLGRIPLDWTTRLSLALGAARGLARIHVEYSATKVPHGNVKSSNVLVDKNGVACISDFGLALLLSPVLATARLGGYQAPEQAETKKLSQMADVYSFGVLVLEMLTGKPPPSPGDNEEQGIVDLPSWVQAIVKDEWTAQVFDDELLRYKNIEEELMTMLHIGLACVAKKPENRPTMIEVTKMIEDIRVALTPLDESRSSLSPSNATTEDARASY